MPARSVFTVTGGLRTAQAAWTMCALMCWLNNCALHEHLPVQSVSHGLCKYSKQQQFSVGREHTGQVLTSAGEDHAGELLM